MSAAGQPLSGPCKPVALASHRVQPTGSARIVSDGATQSDDVVIDGAERCHRVHTGDLLDDIGAPHDLAAAHYRLARAHHALDHPQETRQHLLVALEIAPHYRDAQRMLLKTSADESSNE